MFVVFKYLSTSIARWRAGSVMAPPPSPPPYTLFPSIFVDISFKGRWYYFLPDPSHFSLPSTFQDDVTDMLLLGVSFWAKRIRYRQSTELCLASSKILPPPLSTRRVCPPPATKAVGGDQYFGRRKTKDQPLTVIISLRFWGSRIQSAVDNNSCSMF